MEGQDTRNKTILRVIIYIGGFGLFTLITFYIYSIIALIIIFLFLFLFGSVLLYCELKRREEVDKIEYYASLVLIISLTVISMIIVYSQLFLEVDYNLLFWFMMFSLWYIAIIIFLPNHRNYKFNKGNNLYEEKYSISERLILYLGVPIIILVIILFEFLFYYSILNAIGPGWDYEKYQAVILVTLTLVAWPVTTYAFLTVLIHLWNLFQPVKINANGISMITFSFDYRWFKRVFIPNYAISKIDGYYSDVFDFSKGIYSGYAIKTKDGKEFKSGKRFRNHIGPLFSAFRKYFPKSLSDNL
jgi:heme/copper-type cytochrome/quinol oxidase subunit 2